MKTDTTIKDESLFDKMKNELLNKKYPPAMEQEARLFLKNLDEETGTIWTEDDEEIIKQLCVFATIQNQKDNLIIDKLVEALGMCTEMMESYSLHLSKPYANAKQLLNSIKDI